MGYWEKFDSFVGRIEKKGFNFANKFHMYSVNILLMGLVYGTYTLFRDYNEFFKAGRVNF